MYPPKQHVDESVENAFHVIESYPFATLISSLDGGPVVTQVPLILDRTRGERGFLIGHMDRSNPHIKYLDCGKCLAIFHGPNAYISPKVYETSQLPTWNSISVHVTGTVTKMTSLEVLRDSLVSMTRFLETGDDRYELNPQNEKMLGWLDLIVGFELEIEDLIGRYKLSQDKCKVDMELAKEHLLESYGAKNQEVINRLLKAPNNAVKNGT